MRVLTFVSDGEAAVAEAPGGRPFGLPAVSAEAFAGLGAGPRDARDEPALAQPGQVCSAEKYALSGRSVTGRRRRGPRRDRTAGMPRMSGLRARLSCMFAPDTATASGMPRASDRPCSLLPFLPRSTGFGPVSDPPFFASTEAASTIAEVQSTSPRAPSSSSTARCSRRHRPASVHTVKRRCAVAGDVPNVGGRCRQAQPLVSAYTTAVNTARSSHGAVPPPCGRAANDPSNGAAGSQSSSGTRRFNRSAPTTGIMAHEHQVT